MNFRFYYLPLAILLCSSALASEKKQQTSCPALGSELSKTGVKFVPFKEIMPGQTHISQEAVDLVANNAQGRDVGYFTTDATKELVLCADDKKSPFTEKPFKVLALPQGAVPDKKYVLIDGHHSVIGTVQAVTNRDPSIKATLTVPVIIDTNFSHLSLPEFWKAAAKAELVYLGGKSELSEIDLTKVPNNDMRGLLQNTAVNCKKDRSISYGNKDRNLLLWIQEDNVPFIEFRISGGLNAKGALSSEGFQYVSGSPITEKMVQEARRILQTSPSLMSKHVKIILPEEGGRLAVYDTADRQYVQDTQGKLLTPEEYCTTIVGALPPKS